MSKVIHIEKTDVGATLTTWIYCAFWQMWSAEQLGYDAYINWPDGYKPPRCLQPYYDKEKFLHIPNMFAWYFKQPKVEYALRTDVWTWEDCKEAGNYSLMAQSLSVIKQYYKKHLHFSDSVNQRGEALVTKYRLNFKNIIGITWRGTDNVTDGRPRLPIEVYFPFIDDILKEKPDLRIMATAEEQTILDPLLKRYPNAFMIDEFYSAPLFHKYNPERFSPLSGYERGMQPALMVWLFSKCAYYIKNRSSTGAVASWLSDGRIISLGHPENLGFPANTETAEIDGKLYPLYR